MMDFLKLKKSIVLVGLMGSGKSSVGKKLSKTLDIPFTDTDQEIEERSHCSLADLFHYAGPDYFKDLEFKILESYANMPPRVIATGGDASFIHEPTRELIKKNFISIWINASFDVLMERLNRNTTHRPMLDGVQDRETMVRDLMAERNPVYQQADIHVSSDKRTHNQTVNIIIAEIERLLYDN